jgi:hypothetical protein
MTRLRMIIGLAILMSFPSSINAQVKGKDRDTVKQMCDGTLYLRNNLPCRYKSGGFGIGAEVITEVSPEIVDWERNLKAADQENAKKKRRGIDTIYWGFLPNDVIRYAKLYFKGDVIELWAEGAKPKDTEVWIRFINIKTLDDFKKAYSLILSKKPIQDEHTEWAGDIREAVAQRKVIIGMTKEQAFAVVGNPVGTEKREADGKLEETWIPRQELGAAGDLRGVLSGRTGFPTSLRFIDGKVSSINQGSQR